jgi:hypothetical protein
MFGPFPVPILKLQNRMFQNTKPNCLGFSALPNLIINKLFSEGAAVAETEIYHK